MNDDYTLKLQIKEVKEDKEYAGSVVKLPPIIKSNGNNTIKTYINTNPNDSTLKDHDSNVPVLNQSINIQ